jgi:hypothetical protein
MIAWLQRWWPRVAAQVGWPRRRLDAAATLAGAPDAALVAALHAGAAAPLQALAARGIAVSARIDARRGEDRRFAAVLAIAPPPRRPARE